METMVPDVRPRTAPADFVMFTRSGGETAETPTEKLVLLPSETSKIRPCTPGPMRVSGSIS